MITNITLENFKCFRKLEVEPRLITVFIGPNGSGKSSVLQALALLKQSVGSSRLSVNGKLLELPDLESLRPRFQNIEGPSKIVFGGERGYGVPGSANPDNCVQFQYGGDLLANSPVFTVRQVAFSVDGEPVRLESPSRYETVGFGRYSVNLSSPSSIATIASVEGWPEGPESPFRTAFRDILDTPTAVLNELRFVPAVRGLVRPRYILQEEKTDDVSMSGGLGPQEEQTATSIAYARPMERTVSDWLEQVTGVGLRADMVPSRSVELVALAPTGDVNLVSEGFGTNALVLLMLQLASASKGATVMIEEPEIHLHPRAQAELASLLAEVAKAEDKQLIMTTHSEHLLGRLLTLVAEGKLATGQLAIYAFEKDDKGECTTTELEVTSEGKVKGGVKGFFEANLDELERYMRALQPTE